MGVILTPHRVHEQRVVVMGSVVGRQVGAGARVGTAAAGPAVGGERPGRAHLHNRRSPSITVDYVLIERTIRHLFTLRDSDLLS